MRAAAQPHPLAPVRTTPENSQKKTSNRKPSKVETVNEEGVSDFDSLKRLSSRSFNEIEHGKLEEIDPKKPSLVIPKIDTLSEDSPSSYRSVSEETLWKRCSIGLFTTMWYRF